MMSLSGLFNQVASKYWHKKEMIIILFLILLCSDVRNSSSGEKEKCLNWKGLEVMVLPWSSGLVGGCRMRLKYEIKMNIWIMWTKMDACMDRWIIGWIEGQTDGRTDSGRTCGRTRRRTDIRTDTKNFWYLSVNWQHVGVSSANWLQNISLMKTSTIG